MHHRHASLYSIGLDESSLVLRPSRVRRLMLKSAWPKSSDVPCSIQIGVNRVTTRDTSEVRLIGTIGTGSMTTTRAHLGSPAWVNEDNWDAMPSSLVLNKADQLSKGPRGNHALEPFAALETITDTVETLQDDNWVVIGQSNIDDSSTDLVAQITHVSAILASLGFDTVKSIMPPITSAQVSEMLTFAPCFLATEKVNAIWRSDSRQPHDTQVNAYESRLTGTSGRHWGYADRQHHIPVVITLEQLGIPSREQETIMIFGRDAQHKPNILPTYPGRNAQDKAISVLDNAIGIDSQANALRTVDFGEGHALEMPRTSGTVVRSRQRHSSIDSHTRVVGGKTKLFARCSIDELMQLCSTGSVLIVCSIKAQLNRLAEGLRGIFKPLALALCGLKYFDHNGLYAVHSYIIARVSGLVK